ncbi:hypothetical protein ASF31_02130 [Brevundimonas sp. Leaf280]|uniref:DUF5343 domain-containing protein n=1 Tax=Brevundimonas sp. Leaf280 TaxID=1736320 RepID=UPI0006FD2CD9|nr:DUF5343 domain-containing protein [Brevundimonas sp. Leaf280]KQP48161.1 hypothetical protein ASF31_02130 [Brevundimonas sp. Leaf280]
MADYTYTTVPGKIKPLLQKIQTVGVPPVVTQKWLKSIGFTSSNDGSLIGVLKQINLIDQSGVPTDRWNQYRGPKHREVLGTAIKDGYADLYSIYPDAHQRTRQELESVFVTSTKGGKEVVGKLASTFRQLADEAAFGDAPPVTQAASVSAPALHAPVTNAPAPTPTSGNPSLHIDVQIHISADSGPEQIDQIFASMAKHLYGKGKPS